MSRKENVLLQKTEIGKVKAGFHRLPEDTHVYGKAPVKDKFGAREVVSGWEQHKVSQIKQSSKNFVAMNKEGVKKGCVDAKQLTDFRKNNEILVKIKEGEKNHVIKRTTDELVYGIPNRPSTPIKNIICNTYAEQELQLKRQRQAVHALLENEKKAPPAIEPKKPVVSPNKKKEVDAHSFKLSKFKNVESKIKPLLVNRGNGGNVNEGTNVNLAKKQ